MKHVHAVGVIFEDIDGEILVLKRQTGSPEENTWGLVGGNVDRGEDGVTAAIREAEEEIGYSIPAEELHYQRTYVWERENITITFEVFQYRISKDEIDIDLDTAENTGHMWAMPNDLYKLQDLMTGLYPILKDSYAS